MLLFYSLPSCKCLKLTTSKNGLCFCFLSFDKAKLKLMRPSQAPCFIFYDEQKNVVVIIRKFNFLLTCSNKTCNHEAIIIVFKNKIQHSISSLTIYHYLVHRLLYQLSLIIKQKTVNWIPIKLIGNTLEMERQIENHFNILFLENSHFFVRKIFCLFILLIK